MTYSSIEWTGKTWNPVTGCTKISQGCKHCYAERMTKRLKAMGVDKYQHGFEVQIHQDTLTIPLHWKKPQTIFVNSMSDLFHKDVPVFFIQNVFQTMQQAHWHQFQILTKRSERLLSLNNQIDWPPNVWMGVSVENQACTDRIDDLRQTKAVIKFLSLEPLLGPLPDLNLKRIDWVIVGGESGPGAREMPKEWVINIKDQCLSVNVPFFFKQWGGVQKKRNGRELEGQFWNGMPKLALSPA
ncbi:phage Gp37/Gp68 family protein [Anaerolineales bacterium HSG6]|nr:phage Gp37/Gp68 family protein [Anaerolineales bacterium HSG6]MDM8530579.1 phage Gp37/Gp68 family protein [Anaerolineales bacterium HSG25]